MPNFVIEHRIVFDGVSLSFLQEVLSKMSELSDKLAELKAELAAAVARIAEDFDALKAALAAGSVSPGDLAALQESIDALKAIDPDPDNPPIV